MSRLRGDITPEDLLSGDLSYLGIRGKSAYDLVVEAGYEGTLQDFVDLLTKHKIEFKQEGNTTFWKYNEETEWRILTTDVDYNDVTNKPKINGKEIDGNVSLSDIGAISFPDISVSDTDDILDIIREAGQAVDYMKALDVKDFGAAGDGTTDDTDAIQAAITAAIEKGVYIVHMPKGVYSVRGLTVPPKAIITGDDINSTHIVLKDGYDTIINLPNPTEETYENSVRTIKNVSLYGTSRARNTENPVYAIKGDSCPYLTLDNVDVWYCDYGVYLNRGYVGYFNKLRIRAWITGFDIHNECQGIYVNRVHVANTSDMGFHFAAGAYSSMNNLFVEFAKGGTAIWLENGSYVVNGFGCELCTDLQYGIRVSHTEAIINNAMVQSPNRDDGAVVYNNRSKLTINNSHLGFINRAADGRHGRLAYVNNQAAGYASGTAMVDCLIDEMPVPSKIGDTSVNAYIVEYTNKDIAQVLANAGLGRTIIK